MQKKRTQAAPLGEGHVMGLPVPDFSSFAGSVEKVLYAMLRLLSWGGGMV